MSSEQVVHILNVLLVTLYRSLPMFLTHATPWTHSGDEGAKAALDNIVADQERDCRRLAEAIAARSGAVEQGEFLMEFTNLHFLSLDYLLGELVRYQRQDVARIEILAPRLQGEPEHALAQEILGSERAHLEQLEELARTPVGA
jgi:hypothetical protein